MAGLQRRIGHRVRVECFLKSIERFLQVTIEGEIALGIELLLQAVAEDEAELPGPDPLDVLQKVGVGTQLDEKVWPGRSGELGIDGPVGPSAELAWRINSDEKVGIPVPPAGRQVALVNEPAAFTHRGKRPLHRLVAARDLLAVAMTGSKQCEHGCLVLSTLTRDQFLLGVSLIRCKRE